MKQTKRMGICGGLLLVLVLLGAGCAGSSSSSGSSDDSCSNCITSGTIGGLAFTVTAGTVTQETADGPITAGTTEATILFDGNLDTLSGTTDDALLRITAVIADGGSVDALAFGTTADSLAGALMATLDRSGNDFSWGVYWGPNASAVDSGTVSPAVADANDAVGLLAAFDNMSDPAELIVWRPDASATGTMDACSDNVFWDNPGGTIDQGNGQRGAIRFQNATISSVTIDYDYTALC